MTAQYTNRKNETYYLQAGRTRTGKPRYWCGRKLSGEVLDAIPDGYEIREDPANARVTLRLIRLTEISPLEIQLLSDGLRKLAGLRYFIVDVDGNSLVVYLPNMSEDEAMRLADLLADPVVPRTSLRSQDANGWLMRSCDYTKMMRFSLVDSAERMFDVHRWCFRGSIDDWIWLGGPAALPELIDSYTPHLGKESFFELI